MEHKKEIPLNNYWSRYLVKLPETGMGYQLVDVEMKNGAILQNKTVLNSTIIQLDENEELNTSEIKAIQIHPETQSLGHRKR